MDPRASEILLVSVAALPLAAYFLWLGWINSSRHPRLVSGAADLGRLCAGFAGLVVSGPVLALLNARTDTASLLMLAGLAAVWVAMTLWGERHAWVIYNVRDPHFWQALEAALAEAQEPYRRHASGVELERADVHLIVQSFPVLRNVTVYVRPANGRDAVGRLPYLLGKHLAAIDSGPTLGGTLFLAVGLAVLLVPIYVALQGTPLWAYLFGSIDLPPGRVIIL